jgi:hypothetical protein
MEGRHAESVRYLKSEKAASFKRCQFVCVPALCDWLVLLRGAAMPVAHLPLGPDTTERSSSLTFHFLNRLSVRWAWNPFVLEYWQFLSVYALFRIGLCRYFQRCVWRFHVTETDCCLLFGEWINQHRLLLLLLLVTFVPFIPETMSLGYIVLQLFVIYHLWYI